MSAGESVALTMAAALLGWAVTAGGTLAGLLLPLPVIGGALVLLRLTDQRQRGRLPAWATNFGFLMSFLDRLTDRVKLQSLLAQKPVSPATKMFDPVALRSALKRDIIGNDEVIDDIVSQVRGRFMQERRTGPIGVFMLAGPPSTGKTEFGRALGRALFGEGGFYRVEMNQYSSPHSGSTLFGASAGHVGSDAMSGFMGHLAANPATVIILDEFEKAHATVQTGFLAAWNDGEITEMTRGRTLSTKQAVFMLTTNAAQAEIEATARTFLGDRRALSDQCKAVLGQQFLDSILSRVDYVFPLLPLQGMELAELLAKLAEQHVASFGLTLREVTAETLFNYVTEAARRGLDARAMKRQIERDITDSLIELKDSGVPELTVYERDGQVFAQKYLPPMPKGPPKPRIK